MNVFAAVFFWSMLERRVAEDRTEEAARNTEPLPVTLVTGWCSTCRRTTLACGHLQAPRPPATRVPGPGRVQSA